MELDFAKIHSSLNFLSESVRLQYTNFIWRHKERLNEYLTFEDAVYRLRLEEPIEYVFNLAEFCGLEFYVDKRCLIPRVETEELVKKAVDYIIENSTTNYSIIDIGTGSGCIILAIAKNLQSSGINLHTTNLIGIDISKDALEVAKINRKALNLDHTVTFADSSFQDFDFSKFENLIICSNLPYIPENEYLQKSVAEFEPHNALFGGKKGDELNILLVEKLKQLKQVEVIFMEGYGGEIVEKRVKN